MSSQPFTTCVGVSARRFGAVRRRRERCRTALFQAALLLRPANVRPMTAAGAVAPAVDAAVAEQLCGAAAASTVAAPLTLRGDRPRRTADRLSG